jgi:hypothetical protein
MRYVGGVVLFFVFGIGHGFCTDGNALLHNCQTIEKAELTDSDAFFLQFCYGYIQAVIDGETVSRGVRSADKSHVYDKSKFCLPESGILYVQLARVVVKYLKEHPEELHWTASALVHSALVKGFSCLK